MQKRNTHLSHRTLFALAALVVTPLSVETGYSQEAIDLEKGEIIRRQQNAIKSDELRDEGMKAYAEGDFETAVKKYREALSILPFGTATTDRRTYLNQVLQDGSIALTKEYRRTGRYDEARDLLEEVEANDPGNSAAKKNLAYIDDQIRTNPSNTYEHTKNVDKVRSALYKGEGYYDLGLYDKAMEEFKSVLRIDPYNKTARRWMERCSAIKSSYYQAAYDQARAEMLMQVDRAWELAVPPIEPDVVTDGTIDPGNAGELSITAKLKQIIIPEINLRNSTVEEAVELLRLRSKELDNTTLDDSKKGINFVVRTPRVVDAAGADAGDGDALDAGGGLGGEAADPNAVIIPELKLNNVPLETVLKYICEEAKLRYKIDEFAVTLLPIGIDDAADIIQRQWTVPPTFITFITGTGEGGGGDAVDDPFAPDAGDGGVGGIAPREDIKTLLSKNGVEFPPNSSASYLKGSSTLIVRNTPTQLELVDGIVAAATDSTPRQIRVTTKFVEVTQENGEELGFDWVATPFGFGSNYFLGGGTTGNGVSRTNQDFINPVDRVTIPGIPASPQEVVKGIVTSGNRSGAAAISQNSIDAILNNPQRTAQVNNVAPGILSLTGLFSKGQVQMIMRGLSQKKGADIMTAPSVVAIPGQSATIEIIREFIYPTEYDPPELPNQVGGGLGGGGVGGGGIGGGGGLGFPVTPANPTSFETKNTGVTLEVEAQIDSNDSIIELRFTPTIVEFEGFINYGSPITAPATDALGNPVQIVITENRIEMPVFSVRSVKTGITIYDGYTVAVGGLMREDVQSVEDKVPILGDLPLVGRLFQTKAQSHIKSNLIIFVTAEIIDATGRRVNASADGPEGAPVPMLPNNN